MSAISRVKIEERPRRRMQLQPNGIDPWAANEADFWDLEEPADRARFLLNYAVLAPSPLNTQPWLFSIAGDQIDLFADRRRGLAVSDPEDRQLIMACGGALHHLTLAMRRFGSVPIVRTFPDLDRPDLLASIRPGTTAQPSLEVMRYFSAIQARRTQFSVLEATEVPSDVVAAMEQELPHMGASVQFVVDEEKCQALSEIVRSATETLAGDSRYRREQASWRHPDRRYSRDGLPDIGDGSKADQKRKRALSNRISGLVCGGPALAVVTSRNDSFASRLDAGRIQAALLLSGAQRELVASYLNQPLEIPEFRQQVNKLFSPVGTVQAILRLGYSRFVRPTPRRPVSEVLVQPS